MLEPTRAIRSNREPSAGVPPRGPRAKESHSSGPAPRGRQISTCVIGACRQRQAFATHLSPALRHFRFTALQAGQRRHIIQHGELAQLKYKWLERTRHADVFPYNGAIGLIQLCPEHSTKERRWLVYTNPNRLRATALSAGWPSARDRWLSRHRRKVRNDRISSFAPLKSAACDPRVGTRSRRGRSTVGVAEDLSARSLPAREALYARPRPEMAREARARRWGLVR